MWIVSIDGRQAINSAHIRRIVIEEKPKSSLVIADLGEEIPFSDWKLHECKRCGESNRSVNFRHKLWADDRLYGFRL